MTPPDTTQLSFASERVVALPPPSLGARLSEFVAELKRLGRRSIGAGTLAVVDQAVVSAIRFFTTIMIGRVCGPEQLGVYTLGFTIVIALGVVQESLISKPYTVHVHRFSERRRAIYTGSTFVHCGFLVTLAAVGLAGTGVWLSRVAGRPDLASIMWAIAAATPFMLLWDFARRYAFAHLRMGHALVLDLAMAAAQAAGIVWLATSGTLSSTRAFLVIGIAAAVGALPSLIWWRRGFRVRTRSVLADLRRNWEFGRWLLARSMATVLATQLLFWLPALLISTTAGGVFAACMTVRLLANPLLLGIGNFIGPKAALALAEEGAPALRAVIRRTTVLMGTTMALFCAMAILLGERVVALLYGGGEFAHQGHTIAVICLSLVLESIGQAANFGLRAMRRSDQSFFGELLGSTLLVLLAPPLILAFGLPGLAYSLLISGIIWATYLQATLARVLRGHGREVPA